MKIALGPGHSNVVIPARGAVRFTFLRPPSNRFALSVSRGAGAIKTKPFGRAPRKEGRAVLTAPAPRERSGEAVRCRIPFREEQGREARTGPLPPAVASRRPASVLLS